MFKWQYLSLRIDFISWHLLVRELYLNFCNCTAVTAVITENHFTGNLSPSGETKMLLMESLSSLVHK